MISIVNVTRELLTPELARSFAALPALPGERRLKPKRLAALRAHWQAGTFVGVTWAQVQCRADGKILRGDGQHSVHMLTHLTEAEWEGKEVYAQITTYAIDTVEGDGATLFDSFNSPVSVRNNEDVMGFFQARHPDLLTISPKLCVQVAKGIALFEKELDDGLYFTPRVQGLYYDDPRHREFVCWVTGLVTDELVRLRHMVSEAGVVAEMLSDWRTNVQTATVFWQLVLRENHPDPDHATRELAYSLKDWHKKTSHHTQQQFRKLSANKWKKFGKEQRWEAGGESRGDPTGTL
jgi:hypothetical protein